MSDLIDNKDIHPPPSSLTSPSLLTSQSAVVDEYKSSIIKSELMDEVIDESLLLVDNNNDNNSNNNNNNNNNIPITSIETNDNKTDIILESSITDIYSSDDLSLSLRLSLQEYDEPILLDDPLIYYPAWYERNKIKHPKYPDQHNKSPEFFKHKKHIFVLSYAGRPIFSRYGDETALAAYMGVISALISNVESMKDCLRSFIAGNHKFVFLYRGPIYLVCVSKTNESIHQLRSQLSTVHSQLISILTGGINSMLQRAPNYDLRHLLGGTGNSMRHLISQCNKNPSYLLDSINVLRMDFAHRTTIGNILSSCVKKSGSYGGKVSKNILYAILLCDTHLINLVRPKDSAIYPSDLLLLINMVGSSMSLRTSEIWTPICLPKFNDNGFLYAYVHFLIGDICLILITSDAEDFHNMSSYKAYIGAELESKGLYDIITQSRQNHHLTLKGLEADISVPELRHFIYKSEATSQYIMPACEAPYYYIADQMILYQKYQQVHERVNSARRRHLIYCQVSNNETALVWVKPGEFELYCVFTSLCDQKFVMTAANRLLRYIAKEANNLFILNAPTW